MLIAQEGQLRLQCAMFRFEVHESESRQVGHEKMPAERWVLMNEHKYSKVKDWGFPPDPFINHASVFLDFDDPSGESGGSASHQIPAWFVPMMSYQFETRASRHKESCISCGGLLIEKVDDDCEPGIFRRFGMMAITQLESDWDEQQWIKCTLPDDTLFKRSCGNGQYEIVLI